MKINTYATAADGTKINIAERSATYAHRSEDTQGAALVAAALAELRNERAEARQKARPSAFYAAPTAPAAPPAA